MNGEKIHFDVIIVGAGPAGVAAGIELKKRGVNCSIIDKHTFPRDKLCGGLITEKTYEVLRELCDGRTETVDSAISLVSNEITVWDRGTLIQGAKTGTKLRVSERLLLDNALKEFYTGLGGVVFEGEKALRVDFDKKLLYTDKNTYSYSALIAADGATSMIRRAIRGPLSRIGFCLECYIPKEELDVDESIRLHFGAIERGYAWVFPADGYSKVGFGNIYDKKTDYKSIFKSYLTDIGVKNPEKYAVKGAFVPFGDCPKRATHKDSVFLVGDAAGMVDAIYGEGLYFSYLSGMGAAKCIADSQDNLALAAKSYEKMRKPWLREIRSGRRFNRLFFSKPFQRWFKRELKGREAFLRFYIDSQVSYYKYSHTGFLKLAADYKRKKRL